ncbi:MAG: hypothetical protein E4H36_01405 [Spirochaetales bacterium]|nr:MAG: hypothetical protein E4H36_01405 [Spirochaetales bacterium]
MKILRFTCVLLAAVSLFSCGGGKTDILKREDLFTLRLGKMEDHLSFFMLDNHYTGGTIDFVMKDGLIYISNQDGGKVMKFNSYGDIISLVYNEEKNPVPIVLKRVSGDTVTNRLAFPYPFVSPGNIAVGSNKMLLVQDGVPKERRIQDEAGQSVFDQVILRFDTNGRLKDYLGQEGVGGTPFPFIERIQVNDMDEIIVFTRTLSSWIVFWFNEGGQLLYTIRMEGSALPLPEKGEKLIPSLEAMYADSSERKIYMKIDYYADAMDPSSKYRYGIQFHKSAIFIFDIQKEGYTDSFEIPDTYKKPEGLSILDDKKEKSITEFLGAASGGYLFLLSPLGVSQYQLMILDRKGKVEDSAVLQIKDDEQIFRKFYLDSSGILSALLCEETGAKLVWWRTDELISIAKDRKKAED